MIIVGAGMSGLLAGVMLRDYVTEIVESQGSLPNNHSAVLRFRTSCVADVLNIPFKKVKVLKDVAFWQNGIADALAYSAKTNGRLELRSITDMEPVVERYVAPPDLITRMAALISAPILFGSKFVEWRSSDRPAVISTIPMPILMKELGWPTKARFENIIGHNCVVKLDESYVNAYGTLYVPNPDYPFARISLTGSELVAECYGEDVPDKSIVASIALEELGINPSLVQSITMKRQSYAKILPIPEDERRKFIMWATEEYNVYSLGRYATWRPGLLLDDVVNDVRVIRRLVENSGNEIYEHVKRKV